VKIWGSGSGPDDDERAARAAGPPDAETLDAIQREGIDLDPESSSHRHPHAQSAVIRTRSRSPASRR